MDLRVPWLGRAEDAMASIRERYPTLIAILAATIGGGVLFKLAELIWDWWNN